MLHMFVLGFFSFFSLQYSILSNVSSKFNFLVIIYCQIQGEYHWIHGMAHSRQ